MVRKRGGQPGNSNALKHGFYSQRVREMALDEAAKLTDSLEEEEALLRAFIRKAAEVGKEAGDIEEVLAMLNGIGLAVLRLTSVLRVKAAMEASADQGSLPEVVLEVIRELELQAIP